MELADSADVCAASKDAEESSVSAAGAVVANKEAGGELLDETSVDDEVFSAEAALLA